MHCLGGLSPRRLSQLRIGRVGCFVQNTVAAQPQSHHANTNLYWLHLRPFWTLFVSGPGEADTPWHTAHKHTKKSVISYGTLLSRLPSAILSAHPTQYLPYLLPQYRSASITSPESARPLRHRRSGLAPGGLSSCLRIAGDGPMTTGKCLGRPLQQAPSQQ